MATTWRGRGGSNPRPAYGSYASYATGSAYGKWGKSAFGARSSSRARRTGAGVGASAYRNVSTCLAEKIASYKTLYAQTQGPGKFGRPSPAILNTFAKWIDKGAIIQTVSTTQLSRWAQLSRRPFNSRNPSVSACKTVLAAKFGKNLIKAVARAKNGAFLVATPAHWQGKPFHFPR